MRKLAYNSGQVPARYQVNRRSLSVETALIACGAFADVRKGKLGDKVVAIRTLRIDQQTDKDDSEKVCRGFKLIIWWALTNDDPHNPALLQGVYHMDEPFPPKYLEAYWR